MRKPVKLPESEDDFKITLKENYASVEWCEDFYVGDKKINCPEDGHWCLSWKHGVMTLSAKKENEDLAIKEGAIFVTLWLLGLDAGCSSRLAYKHTYLE